jgi:hypothetical protein
MKHNTSHLSILIFKDYEFLCFLSYDEYHNNDNH